MTTAKIILVLFGAIFSAAAGMIAEEDMGEYGTPSFYAWVVLCIAILVLFMGSFL